MLEARRAGTWKNRYEIAADGERLTDWDGSIWKAGGHFELAGRRYEVTGNAWGTKYRLVAEDGSTAASAERVGRKHWTVESDGRRYEFRRPSIWRQDQELVADGQPVGSIRRRSMWRSDTVAELPGLPLPVQLFVLAIVLTMWDSSAAAGAAAAGGGAAGVAG